MSRPLRVTLARVWDGQAAVERQLFTTDVMLASPPDDAQTIALDGLTIYPGLINAHDHLELNHYPRSVFRARYDNAHQWGEEVSAQLEKTPYRELRAYPLVDRLFIGGLKNLLSGALTVVQHNPPHASLFSRDFPVRVLGRYGWAHSLHFSKRADLLASRADAGDSPWFIHLAEGTDAVAAAEYAQLDGLGCARPNIVIIHGVGLSADDLRRAAKTVRGLVTCPSTNVRLLGRTVNLKAWLANGGKAAIGSDSRLTADGDLLDELHAAREAYPSLETRLPALVLEDAARLIGLPERGHLRPGAPADWFALPSGLSILDAKRADLALVVRGGIPQIGDPALMARFSDRPSVPALLDGVPKAIYAPLAAQIAACALKEPRLTLLGEPPRRRRLTFLSGRQARDGG